MKIRVPRLISVTLLYLSATRSLKRAERAHALAVQIRDLRQLIDEGGDQERTSKLRESLAKAEQACDALTRKHEAASLKFDRGNALLQEHNKKAQKAAKVEERQAVSVLQNVFKSNNYISMAELVSKVFQSRHPDRWAGIEQAFRDFADEIQEYCSPDETDDDHRYARNYFAIYCAFFVMKNEVSRRWEDDPGPYRWYNRKGRERDREIADGFEVREPEVMDVIHALRHDLGDGHLQACLLKEDGAYVDVDPSYWRSRDSFHGFSAGNTIHDVSFPGFSGRGTIRFERSKVSMFFSSAALASLEPTNDRARNRDDTAGSLKVSPAGGPAKDTLPSPYIEFMLAATTALDLDAGRHRYGSRIKVEVIRDYIERHWPSSLGPVSAKKIEAMATFIRHPGSAKGGFITNKDS